MEKMLNIKELRSKSPEDLNALLLELSQERFKMRMKSGANDSVKSHRFGQIRKLIAQIKTLQNEHGSKK